MTDNTPNITSDIPSGFQAVAVSFDQQTVKPREVVPSKFSNESVIDCAQLIELVDGEGTILYYPRLATIDIGDVLFLRERAFIDVEQFQIGNEESPQNQEEVADENGVVVQIIAKGTANYPQADVKALFRLTTRTRANLLDRSHNEPTEVMDDFLAAAFKVRASIVNGEWRPSEGRVVSRNVDIFLLSPELLAEKILVKEQNLNAKLGDYKEQPVEFFGGGFDKVNLITGMKGAGKSHIAKGIISECLKSGMSAIVFDINNEYHGLPNSASLFPTKNLKFRLDRIPPRALIDMIDRIAPFAERTGQYVRAELPDKIVARSQEKGHVPDLKWLKSQAGNIIKVGGEPGQNMQNSYKGSLSAIEAYNLIMTEEEALKEMEFIRQISHNEPNPIKLDVMSLSSVLSNVQYGEQGNVIIFSIGGLLPFIQKIVVDLVIETLKSISEKQTQAYEEAKKKNEVYVPIYPTIYFEEAHMYMEPNVIDELVPLIRHHGMNLFFITNTPGALPDSVFRLVDNLIMTKMLSKRDIDQIKNCGLTDSETIEGFARDLPKHHALFLSGIDGATKNFPLVFHVRDFGLPPSGITRSMWQALRERSQQQASPAE